MQTPFHTLRVRVSAEQSRLAKLQEGNHLKETRETKLVAEKNDKAVSAQRFNNLVTFIPESFDLIIAI